MMICLELYSNSSQIIDFTHYSIAAVVPFIVNSLVFSILRIDEFHCWSLKDWHFFNSNVFPNSCSLSRYFCVFNQRNNGDFILFWSYTSCPEKFDFGHPQVLFLLLVCFAWNIFPLASQFYWPWMTVTFSLCYLIKIEIIFRFYVQENCCILWCIETVPRHLSRQKSSFHRALVGQGPLVVRRRTLHIFMQFSI